jgi:hypothetical protein
VDEQMSSQVVPLHRYNLHTGRVADLTHMSPEQAATVLVEAFQRTGYAEASVVDAERTRGLVRRDCRRRGLTVRTIGVGARVVIVDEARHDQWLETPDGRAYRDRVNDVINEAFAHLVPKPPTSKR